MIHISTSQDSPPNSQAAAENAEPKKRRPRMCDECGVNPADKPSRLCVGCDAYREHTGAI